MARIAHRTFFALAALFAAAAAAESQQPVVVQSLLCRGEEPFWQLDANRTTAVFNRLVTKGNREVVFRGAPQIISDVKPQALVWRGDSTHLPRETLVVMLREETCRSTMADSQATLWRALLSMKTGEALAGCCTVLAGFDAKIAPVADFAKKPSDDWTRALPDLLPAMNLCVASDGGRVKWIAMAWRTPSGPVRVRMIEVADKTVECEADVTGKGMARVEPANPADAPLPASGALYYPAREQPPLVSCGKLERVMNKAGAVAGYLHYDPC